MVSYRLFFALKLMIFDYFCTSLIGLSYFVAGAHYNVRVPDYGLAAVDILKHYSLYAVWLYMCAATHLAKVVGVAFTPRKGIALGIDVYALYGVTVAVYHARC